MKCTNCGVLYGNKKDDRVIVSPVLGTLCGMCWGEKDEKMNPEKWKMIRDCTGTGSGYIVPKGFMNGE